MVRNVAPPEVVAELLNRHREEPTAWGKSVLAATASCLLQSSDPGRAAETARLAIQATPKNPTGERCAPWGQLVLVAQGTPSAAVTARAMQAWAPWDAYGWLFEALGTTDQERALDYARRAYALSPLDTYVAKVLADQLLARGKREEVGGIALELRSGGYPVHEVAGQILLLRIDASRAQFGAALARAREAMAIRPEDASWVRVERFEIAWRGLEIAALLAGAAEDELADHIIATFLDPEPPPLDSGPIDVPQRIPALCARAAAPAARRCFTRLRALRGRYADSILPGTDRFTDGAERYALGDLGGAARAWRSLLVDPAPFVAVLPDAMIKAFEREPEIVAKLEAALTDRAGELGGGSPAMVRAARRAARAGRRDEARALALRIVEAWSPADETVPAVEEMRALARTR
jgi:hypothetical protein